MPVVTAPLVSGQEAEVEAFLATRAESTVFLRSNLARVGLAPRDPNVPFTGAWMGAFDGGKLAGVAAIFWNDNIVLSAGAHAGFLARSLYDAAPARVAGVLGPWDEVVDARRALGMEARGTRFVSKEILYSLPLDELVVPEVLGRSNTSTSTSTSVFRVRAPAESEMEFLLEWRMAYALEASGIPDTPENRTAARASLERFRREGHVFLCLRDEVPVATSTFNATLPDIVQIGGVYTPPAERSKGYARCSVAGSLLVARARGVARSILFTGEENPAAQKAYVALGFRPVGDYGIVFFVADST